jgi:2-polyprenyl-6-methoxyphenol hydroxylase-like FAD-dependent oxidoreductase
MSKRDTEVLVAGAGPVGLYAALLLQERGIRVQVIDSQHRGTTRSYALALHPRSLELLDLVGLTPELVAAGRKLDIIVFYGSGRRQAEVRLAELKSRYPFILVLPQSSLEAALERRLADKKIEVEWSHRLSELELGETGIGATIQKLGKESVGYAVSHSEWVVEKELTTRAGFIVGADGHQSRVRRALGISFESVAPAQLFAVFEQAAEKSAGDELQVVLDERTSVLWPLGGSRLRWSFEIDPREAEETAREKSRLVVALGQHAFTYLDATMLRRLTSERAPWFEASTCELAWSLAARFERRIAAELGRGSAYLAGDAAHLAAPMGVVSMNAGLWEARELCERMVNVLRQGGRRDELARFAAEWAKVTRPAIVPASAVVVAASAPAWVRENAARIVECLPASGEHLDALMAQLGLSLKR